MSTVKTAPRLTPGAFAPLTVTTGLVGVRGRFSLLGLRASTRNRCRAGTPLAPLVDEVLRVATERKAVEHGIKRELERHPGSPGRYYPFNEAAWRLFEAYKQRGEASAPQGLPGTRSND